MITVAWSKIIANMNMEGALIKDRELDDSSIPFASEVEVLSVPFEKQQQQQQKSTQYLHRPYNQKQQQQTNYYSNNNNSINYHQQPILKAFGRQAVSSSSSSSSSSTSPYQQQNYSPPPYSSAKVKYIQQHYLPPSSSSATPTMSSTITNKKGKKTQRESPYVRILPKKTKKQPPPPPTKPCVIPLFQRDFDGQQIDLYEQKFNKDYLKALETVSDFNNENCDVDRKIDNHTPSSSAVTTNFNNLENINRTKLDNIQLKAVSLNSHVITKSSKNERWAKFFLGKPKRKYNRKKLNRKTRFYLDGDTPEENLAYVIVKIEFKKGGIFFHRRSEVYSLIQNQYKKSITIKNNIIHGTLQDDDAESGCSSNYDYNQSTKTVLRMKFPSEDPTQRAKEHEYMDLLSLPCFQELESNSQLWSCIDELFGPTDNCSPSSYL